MDLLNKHAEQMGRGLTFDLWKNFPLNEMFGPFGEHVGYYVKPNLASVDYAVDAAAATVLYGSDGSRGYIDSTNAAIRQITGTVGGGITIFNSTDNEEAWLQWGGATGAPFIISDTAANLRELIFEFAFKVNSVTDDKFGFFIGLAEEGSAGADFITDAGALKDADYFGFFRDEADGDALDIVYKKNGQTAVTHKGDWKTIAADTWYHVGFRYNAANKVITPWFGTGDRSTTKMAPDTDNVITASDISSSTDIFPDGEELAPIVGLKSAHADDAQLDIRLACCAQLAPAAD